MGTGGIEISKRIPGIGGSVVHLLTHDLVIKTPLGNNKIWYDRHKVREHDIKTGKIKIIARKDFSISTSKNIFVKDIWEGAKKSALRIEKKYGKENLGPWTKFEWGMLNGKVSALRWMMGEDWDELYT